MRRGKVEEREGMRVHRERRRKWEGGKKGGMKRVGMLVGESASERVSA